MGGEEATGHIWRPEVDIRSIRCLPLLLSRVSHLELADSARLAGQEAPGVGLSPPLSAGVPDAHQHAGLLCEWWDLNSGPYAVHSHFTHGAVSLALLLFIFVPVSFLIPVR